MIRTEDVKYIRRWAEAWNRRDMEAILEQFEEDVVFSSPKTLQVLGPSAVIAPSIERYVIHLAGTLR